MFIVPRQTAVASQPAKGPLDHPAARHHDKAFGPCRRSGNLEGPPKVLPDKIDDAEIGAIRPDQLQAAPPVMDTMLNPIKQPLQGVFAAMAVRDARTMHHDDQQQAQRIYHNMALAPRRLFMHIDPARFAAFRSFDALAVDARRAGVRLTPFLHAYLFDQRRVDLLPDPGTGPTPKIAVDGLPGGKIDREHSPLTPRPGHIQNGIHNVPHFPLARPAPWVRPKVFLNQLPFGILKISLVGSGEFGHSPSLPDSLRNTLLIKYSAGAARLRRTSCPPAPCTTSSGCAHRPLGPFSAAAASRP